MLAEQIDRGDERLGLHGQQAGGAVEVVAVGLGIDLDLTLLLVDLCIQHVGAAAEVDDVEHIEVFAQLLLAQLQTLANLADGHTLAGASGLDEDARERYEAREALGADRGLAAAAGAFVLELGCAGASR